MDKFVPDHIHFLATVTLDTKSWRQKSLLRRLLPRYSRYMDRRYLSSWLKRLVKAVDMEILHGPHVVSCSDPGNEGTTGVVVLSTSHSSVHIWDQEDVPYLKMDLYSCKRFDIQTVLAMLGELDARLCEYQVIDRNHKDEAELLSGGGMFRVKHGVMDFRKPESVV